MKLLKMHSSWSPAGGDCSGCLRIQKLMENERSAQWTLSWSLHGLALWLQVWCSLWRLRSYQSHRGAGSGNIRVVLPYDWQVQKAPKKQTVSSYSCLHRHASLIQKGHAPNNANFTFTVCFHFHHYMDYKLYPTEFCFLPTSATYL